MDFHENKIYVVDTILNATEDADSANKIEYQPTMETNARCFN